MSDTQYDTLADVNDWLVPDELLAPEGYVAAFASVIDPLPPRARVLDCAAGPGKLAIGLALRGFETVATDASRAMIERTRALAASHAVKVATAVCRWDELVGRGWSGAFDAVFCVGNSLAHAEGRAGRRAALEQMAAVLRPGGTLALTARNWELTRAAGSRLEVADELIERDGRRGLKIQAWTIPTDWEDPHTLEVTVALIEGSGVTPRGERLTVWPFRHDTLEEELRSVGLSPTLSTYKADVGRYLLTAQSAQTPRTTT